MSVFVFPGQGTQYVGMGSALERAFPDEVRAVTAVVRASRPDLDELRRRGPAEMLARTENAQPAVTAVDLCAWAVASRRERCSVVAGHSVGLLAALVAAGCLDITAALTLAERRGALMGALPAGSGMASVRGLDLAQVQRIAEQASRVTGRAVVVGLVNGPDTSVLSGDRRAVAHAADLAAEAKAHVVDLPVSHGFHSPFMAPAVESWTRIVETIPLATPATPIIADLSGRYLTTPAEIRSVLIEQLTGPVRWDLVQQTLCAGGDHRVFEVGDSKALRGFARSYPELTVHSMADPRTLGALRRSTTKESA